MQDKVDACHRPRARVLIGEVAFEEFHLRQMLEIPPLSSTEIVERAYAMPPSHQLFSEV